MHKYFGEVQKYCKVFGKYEVLSPILGSKNAVCNIMHLRKALLFVTECHFEIVIGIFVEKRDSFAKEVKKKNEMQHCLTICFLVIYLSMIVLNDKAG